MDEKKFKVVKGHNRKREKANQSKLDTTEEALYEQSSKAQSMKRKSSNRNGHFPLD